MAILTSNIEFTGSIGDITGYKLPGSDKTVLRTKGGVSKKKMLKLPSFKRTLENSAEFSVCGIMGGHIRRSMLAMVPLADYNFTPILNGLAKLIQKLDTESKRGERHILLSAHKNLLTGFSLNKAYSFESMVRHPIDYKIERSAGKAVVQLPELVPGVNLMLSKQYPLFRFVMSLGCVSDQLFSVKGYTGEDRTQSTCVYTDWYHTGQEFKPMESSVQLQYPEEISDNTTLILSIGIQLGTPVTDSVVNPAKNGGCAKIFAVG